MPAPGGARHRACPPLGIGRRVVAADSAANVTKIYRRVLQAVGTLLAALGEAHGAATPALLAVLREAVVAAAERVRHVHATGAGEAS